MDYRTAEELLQDAGPIRESIAFHCQQAAEKYIKAFLVCRQIESPKTHSISRLLDQVSLIAPQLGVLLKDAEALTPFGVEIRYPGEFPELLPGQEQTVFEVAKRTREAIIAQLDQHLAGG